LKNSEVAYRKSHRTFDRAYHEASVHCISLKTTDPDLAESLNERVHEAIKKAEETGGSILSPNSVKKSAMHSLGMNSPTKDLVNWLLPSDSHKKHTTVDAAVQHLLDAEHARSMCLKAWNALNETHVQCAIELQTVLNEMQGLEERVIFEVQDMLRKHIVLESSCFANLQYDIQMLFGVMESVSVEDDLCEYIKGVLEVAREEKESEEKELKEQIKEVDGMEGEEEEERVEGVDSHEEGGGKVVEYLSLFNQIGTDLPTPPPSELIDIPIVEGGILPGNDDAMMEFFAWREKSVAHFSVLDEEEEGGVEGDGEKGDEEGGGGGVGVFYRR